MPTVSRIGTKGSPVRNFTCAPYALGPLVAKALEMKCSSRNAPIGTIPLRECRRRRKNEWPLPARIGGTPRSTGEATLAMYRYTPIRFARQTLYYETSRWPRQTVSRITHHGYAVLWKLERARPDCGLGWNAGWRRHPGWIGEIKELRHIRLGLVARCEVRQVETSLDEFEYRGVIHNRVGDKILFGERRYDDQRHAESCVIVCAGNIVPQKPWRNTVWRDGRLRRDVI